MKIQTKIDFFSSNFIEPIGAGVYKISVVNPNGDIAPLYIGESVFVLVRCATHLFEFKKNPSYFGFTKESIVDPNITLKFELYRQIDEQQERKQCEKELIKEILKTQQIICQNGISDRMKGIDEKIESLEIFLNLNQNK